MNERIRKLTELTLKGEMYAHPTKTEYDREDLFLSRQQRESKQLCQFILNQQPVLTEYSKMTGFFNCDSSVVGDAFRRRGHAAFVKLKDDFYCKPVDNLSTFEWQHATADYQKVLDKGIKGIIEEIDESLKIHTETEEAIQKRLESTKLEMENSKLFDFQVINDSIDNAVFSLEKIMKE